MGRPRKHPVKVTKIRGLRLKFYSDEPSDDGSVVSGIADQYGRVMEQFHNGKNWDVRPTGRCIYVNH